jgi:hypothetical protein
MEHNTPDNAAVIAEPPRTVVGFAPSRQTSLERARGDGVASPLRFSRSLLTQEIETLIRDGRKAFHNVEEEEDDDDDTDDDDEMSAIDEWEAPPHSWSASSGGAPSVAGASDSSSSQPIAIPATTGVGAF